MHITNRKKSGRGKGRNRFPGKAWYKESTREQGLNLNGPINNVNEQGFGSSKVDVNVLRDGGLKLDKKEI